MDIRNFFGGKKKGAAAPKAKASSTAATAKSSSSSAASSARGNNNGGNDANKNKKRTAAAAAASSTKKEEPVDLASDSDTEVPIKAKSGNNGKKKKVDIDSDTEEDDLELKPSKSKKARANKSTLSSDEEESSPPTPAAAAAASPRRQSPRKKRKDPPPSSEKKPRRKIVIHSSDSEAEDDDKGSDDADDYFEQAKKKRAAARAGKKDDGIVDSSEDGDDQLQTTSRGRKKKPVATKKVATPKKRKASPKKKPAKRYDSENEDSDEDEPTKDNDDSDDDDFKPKGKDSEDEDDDDDDDDEDYAKDSDDDNFVKQSPRKKKAAAAAPARRNSPRRKPAATTASTSPKKTTVKKEAVTTKKEAPKKKATVKKEAVKKEEPPPKYHPPSSKLTTHIPFLESTSKIQLSHSTSDPLPKLPNNSPNFDTLTLTPHCLTGLTFVFSGILSTDTSVTSQTNAAVSISSPTKGDYYTNRQFDCGDSSCELSRDSATDIVKSLGGRVTTGVSGKTDYLILGGILEDGRAPEEGSKYRKCVEIWEGWRDKYRKDYGAGGEDESEEDAKKGKSKSKKPSKDQDPNNLVEIVHGIHEFYALCVYLSEWKKGTLSESERMELEASLKPSAEEAAVTVKQEVKMEPESVDSMPAASPANPYAAAASATAKTPVANPYASKPVANPYAKKPSPANPYAKAPVANPYASKAVSNPYAKKASPSNPYASTTATASSSTSQSVKPNHPTSGKELGVNSLWADRYAPSSSREILGNADSVNKLNKWLKNWEHTWNNPKKKVKGFTGPNGPWKAALLSGPPGIGKTTTATLVAQESGRDVLELNASDARGKKALNLVLGDVTGSQVLSFDNMGSDGKKKGMAAPPQRRVIIMDEVDGMGAGDRSGMAELIQVIKKSKVPIICICNDRSSQKMKSLTQYCMDLRYRRPTKMVIARRAVEIGQREGMNVEINAAEAMAESCGNDIRQVLNSLQMWSCKKKAGGSANMTYRDLKERQGEINKDEVLRVSMFDACRSIVEGSRGLAGADTKAVTNSLYKRTDAYFVDYMLMGLMVHQNYLKVCQGQFNSVKLKKDDDAELEALNQVYEATEAMSDFGMCEANLRGGDMNWSLLPLCSVLAVKVGHHAGGPTGGMLPGYPEFAGWLGKNSTRNKKIRLLQELRRHMNYKVSADAPELRMNYLPIMRQQFEELLFDKEGAKVTEAIELMDEYGLDRDDVFENLDEFLFNNKEVNKGMKKFGDLDSKSKAAFTRAYNSMAHKAQALVAEQGAEKTGRKKAAGGDGGEMGGAELDVVDDDKAAAEESDDEDNEEDIEKLKAKFLKKGRGKKKAVGTAKTKAGKKGKKK